MKIKETRGPASGTVVSWHADEGWGVLQSPELAGNVFCHFSAVEGSKYVVLDIGDEVSFTWNEVAQDGCRYSAVHVASGRADNDAAPLQDMPYGDSELLGSYETSLGVVLEPSHEEALTRAAAPAHATCTPPAAATTRPSKPPAGTSTSPSQAP